MEPTPLHPSPQHATPWLAGRPRKVITMVWPSNDALLDQALNLCYGGTWSVLDDQVLYAFAVRKPHEQYTVIYLAKLHQAISTGSPTAAFEKIATIPFAVHRTALLQNNAGFATLEHIQQYTMSAKTQLNPANTDQSQKHYSSDPQLAGRGPSTANNLFRRCIWRTDSSRRYNCRLCELRPASQP
jgi:hypothetical protein